MNPFALCRWIGSTLPGGYSTVIIRPSLPGRFGRSFDRRSVTLASCASSVPDIRHASTKITFANLINYSFCLTAGIQNVVCFDPYVAVTQLSELVLRAESARFRNA